MCVACRATRPAADMLRFARAPDGALGFDVRARLPGRGAWTCASSACIQKAMDRGGFERAFEAPVLAKAGPGDPGLTETVRRTLAAEVSAGLGLLRRAGRLAAGRDDVARALAEGGLTAFVLSKDLSDRTIRDVRGTAGQLPVVPGPLQEEVGRAIGRKPTGVIGLLGGPRAALLLDDLRRLAHVEGAALPAPEAPAPLDAAAEGRADGAPESPPEGPAQ